MRIAYYNEYASSHLEVMKSEKEYLERIGGGVETKEWESGKR